ncbi:MAG: T9SS type A sorting domain-containing protein [Ignavibacteria bacterium]|nr:T9SS type A sorting domain-containing protein [Ignavibacteria bacterium]
MKKKTQLLVILLFGLFMNIDNSIAQWVNIGPRGGSIQVADNYNDKMFIVTDYGALVRSTNSGNIWEPVYLSISSYPQILSMDSYENSVIVNHNWSLRFSKDDCRTWNYHLMSNCYFDAVTFHKGIGTAVDDCGNVLRATSNGLNWTQISNIDVLQFPNQFNGLVSHDSNLFVCNYQGELVKSTNDGFNWILVLDSSQSLHFTKLFSTADAVFASVEGKGLLRSTDSGISWQYCNAGLSDLNINSMAQFGSKIYCSGYGVVFVSTDNGNSWIQTGLGLPQSQISGLISQSRDLFACSYDFGLFNSTNEGTSWTEDNSSFSGHQVSSFSVVDNYLLASTTGNKLLRTSNNGLNWSSSAVGITGVNISRLLSKDGLLFCVTYDNVFRSTDQGDSWTSLGLNDQYNVDLISYRDYIYALSFWNVQKSSDNGQTWTSAQGNIPSNTYFTRLNVTDTEIYVSSYQGIYRSYNFGANWNMISNSFRALDIVRNGSNLYAVAEEGWLNGSVDDGYYWSTISIRNQIGGAYGLTVYQGTLFVACDSGICYSSDNFQTWHIASDGLPGAKRVDDISVIGDTVYAQLHAGGIVKRNISEFNIVIPDDIGVYNVSSPRSDSIYITNCDNGVSIIPKAIIGNLSGNNHSNPFEVRCEIRLDNIVVYSDTLQDTIGAYGSHTLTFSTYVVSPYTFDDALSNRYYVKIWTSLESDYSHGNDTGYTHFKTLNPGYGFSDAANYYFLNSSGALNCIPDQPGFNWIDTTGSVSLIANGQNAVPYTEYNSFYFSGSFRLPDILPNDKKFKFFGTCYDTIVIAGNGIIGFGNVSMSRMNVPFPIALPSVNAPRPAIFPFWYWFNFLDPEPQGRNLKYKILDDKFVITYDRVPIYNTIIDANDFVSFQVVLHIGQSCIGENGKITLLYDNSKSGSTFLNNYQNNNLNAMTIGIQNSPGTIALTYRRSETNHSVTVPGPLFDNIAADSPGPLALEIAQINEVLPVELLSFTSNVNVNDVSLRWIVGSETDNAGFEIERKSVTGTILTDWITLGFVRGIVNSNIQTEYTYADKNLASGKYNYRLKQIDVNGNFRYYDMSNTVVVGIPEKFRLGQNYPNPFNPITRIEFDLPMDVNVELKLYDTYGREVKTLVSEIKKAGYYSIELDCTDLSSGAYFYQLRAGDHINAKMLMVIR